MVDLNLTTPTLSFNVNMPLSILIFNFSQRPTSRFWVDREITFPNPSVTKIKQMFRTI